MSFHLIIEHSYEKKQGKKLNRTKSLLTSFARCVTLLAYLIFWYVSVILIVDYIGSITSLSRNQKMILDRIVKNVIALNEKRKKAIWGIIILILNILANVEVFH